MVRERRLRGVDGPGTAIGVITVDCGGLLAAGRGDKILARVRRGHYGTGIGNDLHTHPSAPVVYDQPLGVPPVEGINHLSVRPCRLYADQLWFVRRWDACG